MINIIEKINILKKEKNAVILAHYYTPKDVQEIADYIGDSFYLSKLASQITQDTIVFCGVHFMCESAKILNPEKTILMPDLESDCPMAHFSIPEDIQNIRLQYQDLAVVCYINSTSEVKAYSDVCVTSSNAIKVIQKLPEKNIYFIPDQNLAQYVAQKIPDKNFIFHKGYCPTHMNITLQDIISIKKEHPHALVLAHPECSPEVLKFADYIGSTLGIIQYASLSCNNEYIIATELGVIHELTKKNPTKFFYPVSSNTVCPNMKKNSLKKILTVLETGSNEILVSEDIRIRSLPPLSKMLELA